MMTRRRCCCTPSSCTLTHTVYGCTNLVANLLSGATVHFWNTSGKTVDYGSGVTDSSGNAGITLPGSGTYYREISHPRFTTLAGNRVVSCTGGTPTATLIDAMWPNVGASYVCYPCCGWPLARTLTFTSAFFGTWTGDWTSATVGGFTAGADCHGCGGLGRPQPVTIYPTILSTGGVCTFILTIFNAVTLPTCPTSYAVGRSSSNSIGYTGTITCPPSFSFTGTASFASHPANILDDIIGCSVPWTDTLTVTE